MRSDIKINDPNPQWVVETMPQARVMRDMLLLPDGTVVIINGASFGSAELRLEAFSPDYLDAKNSKLRPRIIDPKSQAKISYGRKLFIRFSLTGNVATNLVSVTMVAPSFNTHSFSMNQRLLVLAAETVRKVWEMTYQVQVTTPASGNLAPSGYYLLYVVHQQIPSEGIWVQIL
ncbi:hypothetical protein ACFX2H_016534 [Malus domestica]